MRIVTWNLKRGAQHKHVIMNFLRHDLRANIALLQETRGAPTEAGETVLPGRTDRQARLAVYARGFELRYHPDDTRLSEVARSRVLSVIATLPRCELLLVNIHQLTGQWRRPAGEEFFYVIPELQRVFEAAVDIGASTPMIIGGDLNAAALFDVTHPPGRGHPERSHAAWFERWHGGPLFNARIPFHPEEVRTLRTSKEPYQDDHVFVSSGIADRLVRWEVVTSFPEEWTDHYPVVCDLDL